MTLIHNIYSITIHLYTSAARNMARYEISLTSSTKHCRTVETVSINVKNTDTPLPCFNLMTTASTIKNIDYDAASLVASDQFVEFSKHGHPLPSLPLL